MRYAYLFKGASYAWFDRLDNITDQGYPLPIRGNWRGRHEAGFGTDLDAALPCPLRSVPARNRGTAVVLARLRSPVRGFRTIRAARGTFSKTPKPVIFTHRPQSGR